MPRKPQSPSSMQSYFAKGGTRPKATVYKPQATPTSKKTTPSPRPKRSGTPYMGALDINLFQEAISKFGDEVEQWIRDTQVEWITNVAQGLIDRTPRLTGRARANWQLSFGAPGSTSIPGPPYPEPMIAILQKVERLRVGQTAFLFNNVAYISNLENGSSTQAPQGMIGPTLAEVSAQMGGYIDALDRAVGFDDLDEEL